jgi:hypothetical protein
MVPKGSVVFNRNLLTIFIAFKFIVIFMTIFFFYYFDTAHEINLFNRWYTGKTDLDSIYLPFSNWDGQHYLLLADKGYGFWQPSHEFFPLFPLLIRFFQFFFKNFYFSAFIVNTLCSFLFFSFYYRYAQEFCTKDNSLKSTIFVLTYPSAFYLTMFYSEALFLFLLFAFIYFYHRKSYWSLLFFALMPLARGQALFVLIAFVSSFLLRVLMKKPLDRYYELLNIASIVAGGLFYFGFMQLTTGSPFSSLEAQKMFVFEYDLWNCVNPVHFLNYVVSETKGFFGYNHGLIDKIFVILVLASLPIVLKSRDSILICMFTALAYFPASIGSGGSYIRHSLLAIPFLSIAVFSIFPMKRGVFFSVTMILFVLQMFFLWRFSLNLWVS